MSVLFLSLFIYLYIYIYLFIYLFFIYLFIYSYFSSRLRGVPVRFSQRAGLGTMGSNNVSNCKDELLARMRDIAHADDMAKFNGAVDALKQLPIWNQNKALRDWFLGTWLKEQKVLNTSLLF